MKLAEIRAQPTVIDRKEIEQLKGNGWHESVLRSYHIVKKVKELLRQKTPPEVIIEIIEDLENATT